MKMKENVQQTQETEIQMKFAQKQEFLSSVLFDIFSSIKSKMYGV
jgi:hypothetical protein